MQMEVNVTARNQTVQSNASMLYWIVTCKVNFIGQFGISVFTFMRHSTAAVDSNHTIRVQWMVVMCTLLHFFWKLYLQTLLCQSKLL